MEAGKYNRYISIYRKTTTYDGAHSPVEVWTTLLFGRWAQIITTGGKEYYAAQKLNAETSAVFKIRYTNKVDTTMRIKLSGKTYQIISVADPDGLRNELIISAKEVL